MSQPEPPKSPVDSNRRPPNLTWRKNLWHAFIDAEHGLEQSLSAQRNLKLHWWGACLVLCWCLACRPTSLWVTAALVTSALVMASELFNTALEYSIDLAVGCTYHEIARLAKDAAAGGVLLTSIGAACLGVAMLVMNWPWHWWLWSHHNLAGAVESVSGLAALLIWGIRSRWRNRY